MNALKLARLPDRVPIKIGITVSPDLHRALQSYAKVYEDTYGQQESVADLIPFILEGFLANDRGFIKAQKTGLERRTGLPTDTPAPRRQRRNAELSASEASEK